MEELVKELYEEFIISEVCSRYYRDLGGDHEVPDWSLYFEPTGRIELYKNAAQSCICFLKTNDSKKILLEFKLLKLYEKIRLAENYLEKENITMFNRF